MREEIMYPVSWDGRTAVTDSASRIVAFGECVGGFESVSGDRARRIAACLNACRDISTEDLELCGENAFNRNWNLRRLAQDAMFNSGDAAKGE